MTDTTTLRPDDIETDADTPSTRLDRQADALLEDSSFAPRPLRRAVREDASELRAWGRERAGRVREAVEGEPVKATLYALGAGVLIGLLLRR